MSGEHCESKTLVVEIQENGIIRLAHPNSHGRIIARLNEGDVVNFDWLGQFATEDEKLIRDHVIKAQGIIGEWGTPSSDMMSSSQKSEKDAKTLDLLLEVLDQSKLVEAIRRNK